MNNAEQTIFADSYREGWFLFALDGTDRYVVFDPSDDFLALVSLASFSTASGRPRARSAMIKKPKNA